MDLRLFLCALIALATQASINAENPGGQPELLEEPTLGFNNNIPSTILTPDNVDGGDLGLLQFNDGLPTPATVTKCYNHLDHLRAVEVFLNFIPATSVLALRRGHTQLNATKAHHVLLMDALMDSNPLFLTGNTDTVYAMAFLDLERDGATVVVIPPQCGPSTINDAFFRFVVDMGAVGPDTGRGGRYLILPPDYKGEWGPPTAVIDGVTYFVARSTSYVNFFIARGFLVDGDPNFSNQNFRSNLHIYPLRSANQPPEMKFFSASTKVFNTIHSNDKSFYAELWRVLQKEPIAFVDPELRGLASSIGIRKGHPYDPPARMQTILTTAAAVGNAISRTLSFAPRNPGSYIFPARHWYTPFVGGSHEWLVGEEGEGGRNLDARSFFFYIATVNTPAMVIKAVGKGSQYAMSARDDAGEHLRGEKHYKLTIPADVPAKEFWSVVVYDPQTRSQLQTKQPFPSKNNQKGALLTNADGSIDLYFGPSSPVGREHNWIQTVAGKGWFVILRLYGPLEPWFDRSWVPGDIELVK